MALLISEIYPKLMMKTFGGVCSRSYVGSVTLPSRSACHKGVLERGGHRTVPMASPMTGVRLYNDVAVEDVAVEKDLVWDDVMRSLSDARETENARIGLNESKQQMKLPRLGYACDNLMMKRTQKVYTSRNCMKKTFAEKGLTHVSTLALANCLDLIELIAWNHQNGISFYRMTSKLFPWSGHYALEELPDYDVIRDALSAAGELARAAGQRITNHPSCYVKLASTTETITENSIKDLEIQSQIFDLMGYEPSPWNKINIHVGGVYGNKCKTLERFANTFHNKLSDGLRARLTIENDDSPNSYSVDDLLVLHEMTGIPITFDFHHYQFCPGELSKKEALECAMKTWPRGVRPVVHWSEMPECPQRRKTHPHSHSNFVYGPMNLYGYEDDLDVMIESKAKEAALLLYRDKLHALQ